MIALDDTIVTVRGKRRVATMHEDELRLVLSGFLRDDEELDEVPISFRFAREMEDVDSYAQAIIEQSSRRDIMWVACADVASALGDIEHDYDESVSAIYSVVDQWQHIANKVDPCNGTAIAVRMKARQLQQAITNPMFDKQLLPDLIFVCRLEDELREHAAGLIMADKYGESTAYLAEHKKRIEQAFRAFARLKATLRDQGDIDIEDAFIAEMDQDG